MNPRAGCDPSDGKLVLTDAGVPETEGAYHQWLDVQMLFVSHVGRERTRSEFAELFASVGLELERVFDTPTHSTRSK